ncbi:DCC1-like thiol-disulfide oxidoreductase family protein [Aeoliella mucimassa]|uniref:Vitamin K-dependent gamma-carboxylase n=1 Tax=Aeoliella mucimassa TaxID=2527972 RepID=A0A518AT61_9BACT|nr:DCC1-like thiol-disulfide oxidoreductase family protein [Aeoliella mucimassa]QDU57877.1 Vitamin K-dependent gamma-carboxylase [Aeoliella mucimassa]
MPDSSRSVWKKRILLALLVGWLAALAVSFVAIPRLILDGFDGNSFASMNQRIESHRKYGEALGEDRTREWYVAWAQAYAWKSAALATLLAVSAGAFVGIDSLRRRFWRFLFAAEAPLNLGVLRAVVFGMLLVLLCTEPILEFAAWPRENFVWPSVAGPILSRLPISVDIVGTLLPIAIVATVLAMLGCFTRTTALISVLLSFYLLGIPQCSGKVNHTMHHVVLIGLLVALSRAGDGFSIDSLYYAFRRADQGQVARIHRAVRYGLPIRFAMMVLAFSYFFPGFWKIASNGTTWIFSDNLNNQMLQKWFEIETFQPVLPLYKIPGFAALGALTAVVMELGWPLALLWKPTRTLWACMGLLFHNMTKLLMNISFYTMQAMYVMFVDWQWLLAYLGRKLFAGPMHVMYDGNCRMCRRTMSILLALDWLKLLRPVSAFDREQIDQLGLGHLEDDALMRDMHAAEFGATREYHITRGFDAYQRIAWRMPVLWLTLPIVYLPPVAALGKSIYRRVADTRACSVPIRQTAEQPQLLRWWPVPLIMVAVAILSAQVVLGIGRKRMAWPVACYPLFDTISSSTIRWPEFEAVLADGSTMVLDDDALRDHFTESRYVPPLKRFIGQPVDREELRKLAESFVPVWDKAGYLGDSHPQQLSVYIATYELTGPARPAEPTEREHLLDFEWDEVAP